MSLLLQILRCTPHASALEPVCPSSHAPNVRRYLSRYYHHMYSFHINRMLTEYVAAVDNCEDILINLLVSRVTRRPPIKLSQGLPAQWADPADVGSAHGRRQRFAQRQACLGKFVEQFGYMPLLHSELRLDPVLFKDPVSVQRKKYSNVEHVGG